MKINMYQLEKLYALFLWCGEVWTLNAANFVNNVNPTSSTNFTSTNIVEILKISRRNMSSSFMFPVNLTLSVTSMTRFDSINEYTSSQTAARTERLIPTLNKYITSRAENCSRKVPTIPILSPSVTTGFDLAVERESRTRTRTSARMRSTNIIPIVSGFTISAHISPSNSAHFNMNPSNDNATAPSSMFTERFVSHNLSKSAALFIAMSSVLTTVTLVLYPTRSLKLRSPSSIRYSILLTLLYGKTSVQSLTTTAAVNSIIPTLISSVTPSYPSMASSRKFSASHESGLIKFLSTETTVSMSSVVKNNFSEIIQMTTEELTAFPYANKTSANMKSYTLGISSVMATSTLSSFPTATIILKTTVIPTTVNPEIQNPSLKNLLEFHVSGKIEQDFTEDLKNVNSMRFKNISAILNNQFEDSLNGFRLAHSYVTKFSPGSVRFNAALYFKFSANINASDIQRQLAENSTIKQVSVQELCARNTCGGYERGWCMSNTGSATCRCKLGFEGNRCHIAYPVNGTKYSPWSTWSNCTVPCGGGTRRRFRWCRPSPINGGVCIVGENSEIMSNFCSTQKCARRHDDEDYYLVAYICGAIFIAILILMIAFCCTHKYKVPMANKESIARQSTMRRDQFLETYRVPQVAKRPPRSHPSDSPYLRSNNVIPLQKMAPKTSTKGVDNFAFRQQEGALLSDSETIYTQQLKKFLKQAPLLRTNGVISRNTNYETDNNSVLSNYTRSPAPRTRPKLQPKTRKTRPIDINDKIFSAGSSNYKLVMI